MADFEDERMIEVHKFAYALGAKDARECAEMINLDPETIAVIVEMYEDCVELSVSMFRQLNKSKGDPDKLKEGFTEEYLDESNGINVSKSIKFMSAMRDIEDKMIDLKLDKNARYINCIANSFAQMYKDNQVKAAYFLVTAVSVIGPVLANSTEMKDVDIELAENIMNLTKNIESSNAHMEEWERLEGLSHDDNNGEDGLS